MSDSSYNKKPFSYDIGSSLSKATKISLPREDAIRPLFDISEEACAVPSDEQAEQILENKPEEIRNVLSRLERIITEHKDAALHLKIELGTADIEIVIEALIDHAQGGPGALESEGMDEIRSYCLTRLFEELVEEPSNILYTTRTGADSVRYDAMQPTFWIECLTNYLSKD